MWTRRSYHIAVQQAALGQERTQVDGIAVASGHLGIHLRDERHGVWADVTHIPSGRRLGAFKTFGAALSFADYINGLWDWSQASCDAMSPALVQHILQMQTQYQSTAYEPKTVRV